MRVPEEGPGGAKPAMRQQRALVTLPSPLMTADFYLRAPEGHRHRARRDRRRDTELWLRSQGRTESLRLRYISPLYYPIERGAPAGPEGLSQVRGPMDAERTATETHQGRIWID